jgi:ketosteroid isomerase-like protein
MSRENVERFHHIYEEWYARRKLGRNLLADDAEWVNPHDAVEPRIRQGADSFNEAIQSVFDAWDEVRFETERVIDSGDEVVALGQVRGRGRAAGIEVARAHGQIWTFRDGRVIRMRWFHSHSQTLEAAGLSE